jgi:hypothetical protein
VKESALAADSDERNVDETIKAARKTSRRDLLKYAFPGSALAAFFGCLSTKNLGPKAQLIGNSNNRDHVDLVDGTSAHTPASGSHSLQTESTGLFLKEPTKTKVGPLGPSIWRPTQLPIQWADACCALAGGIFYIMGGVTVNHVDFIGGFKYDPEMNIYITMSHAPVAHGAGALAVAVGTDIYVIGGSAYPRRIDKYNTSTDSWTGPLATIPHSVSGHVGFYNLNNDGKIHIFDGDPRSKIHDIYDFAANSWTSGTVPPSPTVFPNLGVRSDGKVVILGGVPAPSGSKAMIYDPIVDSWTTGSTLFPANPEMGVDGLTYGTPRENPVYDDKLFHVGGQLTSSNFHFSPRCYMYDMMLDTYTEIAPFNGIPRDGMCGTFYGNQLFCFGGRYATVAIKEGIPCVDVLTVTKQRGKYKCVWSPNQWMVQTYAAYDPGGSSLTPPYSIMSFPKTGDEYLYSMSVIVGLPGSGGSGGRVYAMTDSTSSADIQTLTVSPAEASAWGGLWEKKMGAKAGNRIILRVKSDDAVTKPSNIFLTIQTIRFVDTGLLS